MTQVELEVLVGNIFRIVFPSLERVSNGKLLLLTLADIVDWDSLAKVNLIAILEEELNIVIDDEFSYGMSSYIEILNYLEKNMSFD